MLKLKTQFASLTNCETKPVNWSKNISKHFHSIRQYGTLLQKAEDPENDTLLYFVRAFFSSNFSVWKGNQSSKRTFFFYRCFNFVLFSSNLFVFYPLLYPVESWFFFLILGFSKLSLNLWLRPKLISYLYFESNLTAWFRTTHKFSNFLEHISLLQKVPRFYIYVLLECLLSERTHSHLITLKSKEKVRKLTGG